MFNVRLEDAKKYTVTSPFLAFDENLPTKSLITNIPSTIQIITQYLIQPHSFDLMDTINRQWARLLHVFSLMDA